MNVSLASISLPCAASKVARVEGVFPLIVTDYFKIPTACPVGTLEAAGLMTDGLSCTVPSSTVTVTMAIAFSHPPPGTTVAFNVYFENESCNTVYTVNGFVVPQIFPGAKIVADTTTSVMVTFFTFFTSQNTTDQNRYSLMLPELLTASGTPALGLTYPNDASATFTEWHSSLAVVDTSSSMIRLNFKLKTSSSFTCDPCVIRVANVAVRATSNPYQYHPGSLSIIGVTGASAVAELPMVLDPVDLPTPTTAIDCISGARLESAVTVIFTVPTSRTHSSIRIDIPPTMRVVSSITSNIAVTGVTGSLTKGVTGSFVSNAILKYTAPTSLTVSTLTLTLTGLFMCPSSADTYEVTVSLLDDLGATIGAGIVPFIARHGELPVSLAPTAATSLTYNFLATSGVFTFTLTIDVTKFHMSDTTARIAIIIPNNMGTVSVNGTALTATASGTYNGYIVADYTYGLTGCTGSTANVAANCKLPLTLAITMPKVLVQFNPYDIQVQLLRTGTAAELFSRGFASGVVSFPQLSPFTFPAPTPARPLISVTGSKWRSESISVSTGLGSGSFFPAGSATMAVTIDGGDSTGCTITPTTSDVPAAFNAGNAYIYYIECPLDIRPLLVNMLTIPILSVKNTAGTLVEIGRAPPSSFSLQPASDATSVSVTMQFAKDLTITPTTLPANYATFSGARKILFMLPSRTTAEANMTFSLSATGGWNTCVGTVTTTSAALRHVEMQLVSCSPTSTQPNINIMGFAQMPGHYQPQASELIVEFMIDAGTNSWVTVHRFVVTVNVVALASTKSSLTVTAPAVHTYGAVTNLTVELVHSIDNTAGTLATSVMNANQGIILTLPSPYVYLGVPTVTFGGVACTITRYGVTSRGANSRYFEFTPFAGAYNAVMRFTWENVQVAALPTGLSDTVTFEVVDKSNPAVIWRTATAAAPTISSTYNAVTESFTATHVAVPCLETYTTPTNCYDVRAQFYLRTSIVPSDNGRVQLVLPMQPEYASVTNFPEVSVIVAGLRLTMTRESTTAARTYYYVSLTAANGVSMLEAGAPIIVDIARLPIPAYTHIKFGNGLQLGFSVDVNATSFAVSKRLQSTTINIDSALSTIVPKIDYTTSKNYAQLVKSSTATTAKAYDLTINIVNDLPSATMPPSAYDSSPYYLTASIKITVPSELTFLNSPPLPTVTGFTVSSATVSGGIYTISMTTPSAITGAFSIAIPNVTFTGDYLNYFSGDFASNDMTGWIANFKFDVTIVRTTSESSYKIPILPLSTSSIAKEVSSTSYLTPISFTFSKCEYQVDIPPFLYVASGAVMHGNLTTSLIKTDLGVGSGAFDFPARARVRVTADSACVVGTTATVQFPVPATPYIYGRHAVVVHTAAMPGAVEPFAPALLFAGPSIYSNSPYFGSTLGSFTAGSTGSMTCFHVTPRGDYVVACRANIAYFFARTSPSTYASNYGQLAASGSVTLTKVITASAVSPDSRFLLVAADESSVISSYSFITKTATTIDLNRDFAALSAPVDPTSPASRAVGILSIAFASDRTTALTSNGHYVYIAMRDGRTLKVVYDWQTGRLSLNTAVSVAHSLAPSATLVVTPTIITGLSQSGILLVGTVSTSSALVSAVWTTTTGFTRYPSMIGSTAIDRVLSFPSGGVVYPDIVFATSATGDIWLLSLSTSSVQILAHLRLDTTQPFVSIALSPLVKANQQVHLVVAGANRAFWIVSAERILTSWYMELNEVATQKFAATATSIFTSTAATVEVTAMQYALDGVTMYVCLSSGVIVPVPVKLDIDTESVSGSFVTQFASSSPLGTSALLVGSPATFVYSFPIISSLLAGSIVKFTLPPGAVLDTASAITLFTRIITNGVLDSSSTPLGLTAALPTQYTDYRKYTDSPSFSFTLASTVSSAVLEIMYTATMTDKPYYPVGALNLMPENARMALMRVNTVPVIEITPSGAMFPIMTGPNAWRSSPPLQYHRTNLFCYDVVGIQSSSRIPGTATVLTLSILSKMASAAFVYSIALPVAYTTSAALTASYAAATGFASSAGTATVTARRLNASSPIEIQITFPASTGVGSVLDFTFSVINPSSPLNTVRIDATRISPSACAGFSFYLPAVLLDAAPSWVHKKSLAAVAGSTLTVFTASDDGNNVYVGTQAGSILTYVFSGGVWSMLEETPVLSTPITHITNAENGRFILAVSNSANTAAMLQRMPSLHNGKLFLTDISVENFEKTRMSACATSRDRGSCELLGVGPIPCYSILSGVYASTCTVPVIFLRSGAVILPTSRITSVDGGQLFSFVRSSATLTGGLSSPWWSLFRENDNGLLQVTSSTANNGNTTQGTVDVLNPWEGRSLPSSIKAVSRVLTAYPAFDTCLASQVAGDYFWVLTGDGRVAIVKRVSTSPVIAFSKPISTYQTDRATSFDVLPSGRGVVVGTSRGILHRFAYSCVGSKVSITSMSSPASSLPVQPIVGVSFDSSGQTMTVLQNGTVSFFDVRPSLKVVQIGKPATVITVPGQLQRTELFSMTFEGGSVTTLANAITSQADPTSCRLRVTFDIDSADLDFPPPNGVKQFTAVGNISVSSQALGGAVACTLDTAGTELLCSIPSLASNGTDSLVFANIVVPNYIIMDLVANVALTCADGDVALSPGVPVVGLEGVVNIVDPTLDGTFSVIKAGKQHMHVVFSPAIYHSDNSFVPYAVVVKDPRYPSGACTAAQYAPSTGIPLTTSPGCCAFATTPDGNFSPSVDVVIPTQDSHGVADMWVRCATSTTRAQISLSPSASNPYPVQRFYVNTLVELAVHADLEMVWSDAVVNGDTGKHILTAMVAKSFIIRHPDSTTTSSSPLLLNITGDPSCDISTDGTIFQSLDSTRQVTMAANAAQTGTLKYRCRYTGDKAPLVISSGDPTGLQFATLTTNFAKVTSTITLVPFVANSTRVFNALTDIPFQATLGVATYRNSTSFEITPTAVMPDGVTHYCKVFRGGVALPTGPGGLYQVLDVATSYTTLSLSIKCDNMVSSQDELYLTFSDPLHEYNSTKSVQIITRGTLVVIRGTEIVSTPSYTGSFLLIATNAEGFRLQTTPPPSRGTMFQAKVTSRPTSGQCSIIATATGTLNLTLDTVDFVAYDADPISDPFYVNCEGSTAGQYLDVTLQRLVGDLYEEVFTLKFSATGEIRITQLSVPEIVHHTYFIHSGGNTSYIPDVNDTTATRFDGSSIVPLRIQVIPAPPIGEKIYVNVSVTSVFACDFYDAAVVPKTNVKTMMLTFNNSYTGHVIQLECPGITRDTSAAYTFSLIKLVDSTFSYPTVMLPFVLEGEVEMTLLDGSSIPETLAVNSPLHARLTSPLMEAVSVKISIFDGGSGTCKVSSQRDDNTAYSAGPLTLGYIPDADNGRSVYIKCSQPTIDESTYILVENAIPARHIVNTWQLLGIKATGTVFLTPSSESHTAPLPTAVQQDKRLVLWLYVDPNAPETFTFDVKLVNPGNNPAAWANCALYEGSSNTAVQSLQMSIEKAMAYSASFGYECKSLAAVGPSIVILPANGAIGYSEFYGSALNPRGYGTFQNNYGDPLGDTIPLTSAYMVQVVLYPQNVATVLYEFTISFSSAAGQCRMWRYYTDSDLEVGDNAEHVPETTSVTFKDEKSVLRVGIYCFNSAVTGPSFIFSPNSTAVWFSQQQSAVMAINGVVTFIQVTTAGDPIPTQQFDGYVRKDAQTMFTLLVQPSMPDATDFRVELTDIGANPGNCGLRLYEIGSLLEPSNLESLFSTHVDLTIARGVTSPSASVNTIRRAIILRCRTLPGSQLMPYLSVRVLTASPSLMYATTTTRSRIVVAGGVTMTDLVSGTFPTVLNAVEETAIRLTLSPVPALMTNLSVTIQNDDIAHGSCLLSYKGSPYANTFVITFTVNEAQAVFSVRCNRVSNPTKNAIVLTHNSGEVYARYVSTEFTVKAISTLMYREVDSATTPAPYVKMLPADSTGELRTVITTHTATIIKLQLPVAPGTNSSVVFSVALDSGSTYQGIEGHFLSKAVVEAYTNNYDAPFLLMTSTTATSINLTFSNLETEMEFYFYTNTPHQAGTNVIPYFVVTRIQGVVYDNVEGPRMRLRAGVCHSIGALDSSTIVYTPSNYYNASWYPESWAGVEYSHYTTATFSCARGYYLADDAKRTNSSVSIISDTMRCEAKKWVGPSFTCEPVLCPTYERDAATTTSAVITPNNRNQTNRFGAAVQINCITGYVVGQRVPVKDGALNVFETVSCALATSAPATSVTGTWLRGDGDPPGVCQPVDCYPIDSNTQSESKQLIYVSNSKTSGLTVLNSIQTFTCNMGYQITSDSNTAYCAPTGYWEWTNGTGPTCLSLDCFAFPTYDEYPDEGDANMASIEYSGDQLDNGAFSAGTTATFTCKEGYRIRDLGSRATTKTCTDTNGWATDMPRCVVLQCNALFPPSANATISYIPAAAANATSVPYLTSGTVVCPTGYNAQGERVDSNNNKTPDRTVAATPKTCVDPGSSSAGSWGGNETVCMIHLCGEVTRTNASVTYANNGDNEERSYLSEAHYYCSPGFEVSPKSAAIRTCHEKGVEWTPAVDPLCVAVTCPTLRLGANTDRIVYSVGTYGPRRLGSEAEFKCESGFVVQDYTSKLTCSPSGTWVHPETNLAITNPQCTRNNCKAVTPKRHSTVTYIDRGYGATFKNSLAVLSCAAGYQIQPGRESALICTDDGWKPSNAMTDTLTEDPVPYCVDIDECATLHCDDMFGPGSECVNTVGGYVCTPYIANYTMRISGEDKLPMPVQYAEAGPINETVRSIDLVDTSGSDTLSFRVFTGENVAPWTNALISRYSIARVRAVRYELLSSPYLKLPCTLQDVATVPNLPAFQRITCSTSAGGGYYLPVSLYFCATRRFTSALSGVDGDETATEEEGISCMWTRTAQTADPLKKLSHVYHVNYPPPTTTPSTLRSATFNDRTGSPNLVGRTTNGQKETVILSGTNFFANPHDGVMQVVFGTLETLNGPDPLTNGFKCIIDAEDSERTTVTTIYCEMDFESGLDLHFLVDVLGQRSITSDTFSFPITLRVFSIDGCTVPSEAALNYTTIGCPTAGNVNMTVYGDGFLEPTAVYVNGDECFLTMRTNDYVFCTLPSGTGISLSVIVTSGSQYFEVPSMLSYAAPRIFRMTSEQCTNIDSINLVNCPRQGGVSLTLEGENFGAQGATVYIGGVSCTNVQHYNDTSLAHNIIYCVLPQGSRTQRSVVVFQRYGELSAEQAYISYTQCQPGMQDINYQCMPCKAGTYTDTEGQSECKDCAPGSYNTEAGLSSCSACRSGTYSLVGSSTCSNCPKGTFSTGNAGSCTTCSVGTYSPDTSANTCLPCSYGGTSDADYAGCHCLSGFFLNHRKECEACMTGGNCTVTGTTYFNVVPLPGYYPTAKATDDGAPRVRRFELDVVTTYNMSQAFEYQSFLALLMRSIYDDTGITRDRINVYSVTATTISSLAKLNLPAAFTAFSTQAVLPTPADAAAAPALELNATELAMAARARTLSGDEEGTPGSSTGDGSSSGATETFLPGVTVVLDVTPPMTNIGENTDVIYKRFLNLMQVSGEMKADSAPLFEAQGMKTLAVSTFYTNFGTNVTAIRADTEYSRSAYINFESCLSDSCVGGLELCATGYSGPLCTVCETGYSKKTTYLCERCGTLSERVGDIMVSLTIAILISGILVFFSVRDTTKNLDLPRIIRSVSHVAFFKIIVCAIQVWAIAGQFDMVWPGVVGTFMEIMSVAGNIGIDAISLDCFSSNAVEYGISNSMLIRPLFLTTIGAFVLPMFALIFPLLILVPGYLIHRHRYTRELAAVSYVAKLDSAAEQASLEASARNERNAAMLADEASRNNAQVSAKSVAAQATVDKKRAELYGSGMALRTAMVKASAAHALNADSAELGKRGGSSVEMQSMGGSRNSGPLAPPPVPNMPNIHYGSDDEDGEGADELFTEFNIDLNQANASRPGSEAGRTSPTVSRNNRPSVSMQRPGASRASVSRATSALGVSMRMSAPSNNNALSQVEFHVDDFVEDGADDGYAAAARSPAPRRRFGEQRQSMSSTATSSKTFGASAAESADPMSAITEEPTINNEDEMEEGETTRSRRPSLSGSDVSRTSMASSTASSRRVRTHRNKSFRESLIGPRLTARGLLKRENSTVQAGGETDADPNGAEPSRSMSRSQMARSGLKRMPSASVLMDHVASQQGTEYLQLQRDRRIFRYTIDRLAELLQTYQYIYICCIATALYLLHPNISRAFFRLIACKTVGGGSDVLIQATAADNLADGEVFDLPHNSRMFVLADMSLVCFSGEHFAWMFTLGLALFVLWIIGVPLGFFLYLRRNARLMRAQPNQLAVAELRQRHRVEYGFSFLFLGFQPRWYYWFIVEMARKVLYVAVSIFFPGQMHVQLLMASFVAFSAISAQTAVRPFEQSLLEHFEFAALLATFNLFFLANFYMIENEITESSKDAITAGIFAAFMLFFVVAVIVLVLLTKQNRRTEQIRNAVRVALRRNLDPSPLLQTWRREERKRREARMGKASMDENLRDIFVQSVEQDARNELDQYLDGSESTSNSRETSVVSTGSGSTSGSKPTPDAAKAATAPASGDTAAAAVAAAAPGETNAESVEDTSEDKRDHSTSHSRDANTTAKAAGSSTEHSTSGTRAPEDRAVNTDDVIVVHSGGEAAPSVAASSHAGSSHAASSHAAASVVSTETAATTAALVRSSDKKKRILKKKPAPKSSASSASNNTAPGTPAVAAHKAEDADLVADLEKAVAATTTVKAITFHDDDDDDDEQDADHNTDFLAQSIAQAQKDVADRIKQRAVDNRFGAVDVAEGKVSFGGQAVTAADVAAEDNLFYREDEHDENELEDNDVWAQSVQNGQNGYF